MLSEQSAPVVRATLPVVGAAVGNITELFYRKLFEAHPELLRDLFNRGNQANGAQQKALAGSIAAFAGLLLESRTSAPTRCSRGSRTSTLRSASPPASTRSSTATSSRR